MDEKAPPYLPTLAPWPSSVGGAASSFSHICYLFSCPLVSRRRDRRLEPLKTISVSQEIQAILKTCRESKRRFNIRFEMARPETFNVVLTLGCKALHFSGHGLHNALAFETPFGEVEAVEADLLKQLVENSSDPRKTKLEFVFVAACHSEQAGRAFVEAGVPHVVAVRWDSPVADSSSQIFARHFYLSLLVGETVLKAYNKAKLMVTLSGRKDEDGSKFLLLPEEDVDHDVSVFLDLPEGDYNEIVEDIPHNSIPPIPDYFRGREILIHEILKLLPKNRLISLHGASGIGKSAVARYVAHFIHSRRFDYFGVFYFNLLELSKKLEKTSPQCLGYLLSLELAPIGFISETASSNLEFFKLISKHLGRKILFIFDEVDIFLDSPLSSWSLTAFLNEFFKRLTSAHVITTSKDSLDFLDEVSQFSMHVDRCSDSDIAQLIKDFCQDSSSDDIGLKKELLTEHAFTKAIGGNPKVAKKALAYWKRTKTSILDIDVGKIKKEIEEEKHISTSLDWIMGIVDEDYALFDRYGVPKSGAKFWIVNFGKSLKPETITSFASALQRYSKKKLRGPRSFTEDELDFLVNVYRDKRGDEASPEIVTIHGFGAFWTWFEFVLSIIDRIEQLWNLTSPRVIFLASKAAVRKLLSEKIPGTFLIKFSESQVGCLAASFVPEPEEPIKSVLIDARTSSFVIDAEDGAVHSRDSLVELLLAWPELQFLLDQKDKFDVLKPLVESNRNVSKK